MEVSSYIIEGILALLCFWVIGSNIFMKDKARVWHPLNVVSLVYLYYCIIPVFFNEGRYVITPRMRPYLCDLGALLSYLCILWGFHRRTYKNFVTWNSIFTLENSMKIGMTLFFIGIACYVPFRGFTTSISYTGGGEDYNRDGFTSYFIGLISLFCASCSLMIVAMKNNKWNILGLVIIWLSFITYIVGGFRFRLVALIFAILIPYYLFPKVKKPNYIWLATIAFVAYLGFAIMDKARVYGQGIDMSRIEDMDFSDASKGAQENEAVYYYSVRCMNYIEDSGDYKYFAPIINAALMPIPRFLFPWKPEGDYMFSVMKGTLGSSDTGAAAMMYVEAFIAFGWLGIIVFFYLFGWFSKIVWNNYLRNRNSIGAIVLLALFNGFIYTFLSRGYLAQSFVTFIYYVVLPFWLSTLIVRRKKKEQNS